MTLILIMKFIIFVYLFSTLNKPLIFKILLSFVALNTQVSLEEPKPNITQSVMTFDFVRLVQQNKETAGRFADACESKRRILGGAPTTPFIVPYQVSLRNRLPWHYYWIAECGGALVHMSFVITAVKCFSPYFDTKRFMVVVAGSKRAGGDRYDLMGESWRRVTRFYQHKYYNPRTLRHNIGILQLESPFEASRRIQPIIMNTPSLAVELKYDTMCLMSGFGKTSRGDHGGPLVCKGVLVGILSDYHYLCGFHPLPFTRIVSYTSGDPIPFVLKTGKAAQNSVDILAVAFLVVIILI